MDGYECTPMATNVIANNDQMGKNYEDHGLNTWLDL